MLEDAELVTDIEGIELPDLEAVRDNAIEAAREIVSEWAKRGKVPLSYSFTVTDEAGKTVLTVPFTEAVKAV